MTFPDANPAPPFRITRASHIVLRVRDVDASVAFYTQVIGLVLTARDDGAAYLRGIEESAHHSLVLRPCTPGSPAGSPAGPSCDRMGFRVGTEDDLHRAKDYFQAQGQAARFVDAPFQGLTLEAADRAGMPLQFCATMPAQKRLHDQFQVQKGGAALRYDHVQCLMPDVVAASQFYLDLGFRVSDYFVGDEHSTTPLGVFLYRKTNPHDVVFLTRPGPVLHHFAYIVQDSSQLFRALDTAGNIGYAASLERGPARHGEGHALYVYFRDPDGHRVEIMSPPIQMGDAEDVPMRWHRGNRHSWEQPAPKSWLYEASPFTGVPVLGTGTAPGLPSLEDFLARRILNVPS